MKKKVVVPWGRNANARSASRLGEGKTKNKFDSI